MLFPAKRRLFLLFVGMTVSRQSQVMAQVTYQALFRGFPKLCGMTGTAATDSDELSNIYGLRVIQVQSRQLLFGSPELLVPMNEALP